MTSASTLRETLSLAHSAQCKLHIAANRPDRNLRFVLGHALTLDNLTLRLVEIEDEMAVPKQPKHASGIQIKAAGGTSTTRKRSPPPDRLTAMTVSDEEDDDDRDEDDDGAATDSDEDELALTRFPSGSTQPQRHVPVPAVSAEPPPLDPSDDSSSSDDEDEPRDLARMQPSEEMLRNATKGNGDDMLMSLYSSVKKCKCHGHHDSGPQVQRMWEMPAAEGEKRADGVRFAVAEVSEED